VFEGKPVVYLDTNILVRMAGKVQANPFSEYVVAYSSEHFTEILRGTDRSVVELLIGIDAVKIQIGLDDQQRMTNEARMHRVPIAEAFAQHEANDAALRASTDLFFEIGSAGFGGFNQQALADAIERLPQHIRALVGHDDGDLYRRADAVRAGLSNVLVNHLNAPLKVEDLRAGIHTDRGRVGHLPHATALSDIWKVISSALPGVTFEQFFQFRPAEMHGYVSWPPYLGIVGAYMALNFVGYQVDRALRTPEGFRRATSDASHVGHAAYCEAFATGDERLAKKAAAIFADRQIGTGVIWYPPAVRPSS
jgi:hypothetical protein